MAVKQNAIRKSKLLIVEGNHERDFFEAWFTALQISNVQVMPIGGKTKLADNLKGLVNQTSFPTVVSLVVVRDADNDAQAAFASVSGALTGTGITPPATAWTFTRTQNPKDNTVALNVCAVILPDARTPGALEELLLQTVTHDPMYGDANNLIGAAVNKLPIQTNPPSVARAHPPVHRRGKAKVHAFLATFEEPDKDQGKAAKSGVWDFSHTALDGLRKILQQM